MHEFRQSKESDVILYAEDTDEPLPEKLNPNTRYSHFSVIDKGGKSIIQSCRDLHLRRTVCYKTLRPEFVNDAIENRRLLREARISAALQHPNTMPTYEIGRDIKGRYYFTMKLVHGYTFREILEYRERYDLTQLVEVLEQVGQALAYAHSKGVLHRDIKPDNILVGPYGEVLLLDWGLAKVWHRPEAQEVSDSSDAKPGHTGMTGEAKLQGTVMYMSPEQVNKDPGISFQSDLYSLGALLYEVLTGNTPFQGDVVRKILDQVRNDMPPDPRSVSKQHVPDVLADLAMLCLQKDPHKRPESAEKLVSVLQENWLSS